ncbi:MAG TPA: hypothetical protein VJY84_00320 [Candidatus Saccharimonadales bacterium]|nr:hypothetical protein [Candidatus Saccharimonadales bacterium]
MADNNYTEVLLEDINDKFDALIDGYKAVRDEIKTLAKQEDLEDVKRDVKTIKKVVTATNEDLKNLDRRVTKLEKAVV